jgi:hypothetical protein
MRPRRVPLARGQCPGVCPDLLDPGPPPTLQKGHLVRHGIDTARCPKIPAEGFGRSGVPLNPSVNTIPAKIGFLIGARIRIAGRHVAPISRLVNQSGMSDGLAVLVPRKPYLMVAVQVIAAQTDAAARRLFTTPQQRFLRLIRNQPVELLPPVDSMEELWQDKMERAAVESRLRAAMFGSNATVKAGLEKLVGDTGADEVIVVTDTYDHVGRLHSYERVADIASTIEVNPTVAVGA